MKEITTGTTSFDDIFNYEGSFAHKTAMEVFTDRVEPRDVFWKSHYYPLKQRLENGKLTGPYDIISFYGEAGVGKTTLLDRLCMEMDERAGGRKKGLYVRFDFRSFAGSSRDVILALAQSMQKQFNFRFPMTVIASLRLAKEVGGASLSQQKLSEKTSSNKAVSVLLAALKASAVGEIVSTVMDGLDFIENNWDISLTEKLAGLFRDREGKNLARIIARADIRTIQKYFHVFFAYDLNQNLKGLKEPVVIMLDTYEHYVDVMRSGSASYAKDYWLRNDRDGLVTRCPGIIWVIAGREKLCSLDGSGGKDSWDDFSVDEHRLGALSDSDVKRYLDLVGITDSGLREYIIRYANGSPYFLDLCYDTYLSLYGSDRQLDTASYARSLDQAIDKYYENMDSDMQDLARLLSLFEDGWTDDMVLSLSERKVLPGFSESRYLRMKNTSSIIIANGDRYVMEENARKVFYLKTSPDLRNMVSKAVLEYLSKERNKDDSVENNLRLSKASIQAGNISYEYFRDNFQGRCLFYIQNNMFEEADDLLSVFESTEEYKSQNDYSLYVAVSSLRTTARLLDRKATVDKPFFCGYDSDRLDSCDREALELYFSAMVQEAMVTSDYGWAISFLEDNYERLVRERGDNDASVLTILPNLASMYTAVGRIKESIDLLEKCYKGFRMVSGEISNNALLCLHNLALAYGMARDREKAFECSKKCYEGNCLLHGTDHRLSLGALDALTLACLVSGRNSEALGYGKECYEKMCKLLGCDHPETLESMAHLANCHLKNYDIEEALRLCEECFEKQRLVLGERHQHTRSTLNLLVNIYKTMGLYEKGLNAANQMLENATILNGGDSREVLTSLEAVISLAALLKNYEEVNRKAERAYVLSCKYKGPGDEDTLNLLLVYGSSFREMGKAESALNPLSDCVEQARAAFGEGHQITADALVQLAFTYMDLNRFIDAIATLEDALRLYPEAYPDDISTRINLRERLFISLVNIGKVDEGLKEGEELLEDEIRYCGEGNINTQLTMHYLAKIYRYKKDFRKAYNLDLRCFMLRKESPQATPDDIAESCKALMEDSYELKDPDLIAEVEKLIKS